MALYRCGSSGGTAETAHGTVLLTTSSTVTVTTGFRPKIILAFNPGYTQQGFFYNQYAQEKAILLNTSGNSAISLPSTSNNCLKEITDTGFVINKSSSNRSYEWFAAAE